MTKLISFAAVACALGLAAAPPGRFEFVDLKPQANQKFTANFGSGRDGNDLANLLGAGGTFAGVNFKFGDRLIQLGSKQLAEQKPANVQGIKVGKSCAKLHILHATCYGNAEPGASIFVADDTLIADYKIHYDDRTTETIPVIYGKDVRDWHWGENSKGVTRGKVAWNGNNEMAKGLGNQIRVYLTTWDNPHPEKRIATIDYARAGDSVAAPFCVAITLESKVSR